MTTLPDPPRSILIDPRTGALTREWTRFFDDLRRAIISGLDEGVGSRLDALEADTLFAGSPGGGDGSQGYNDAAVRSRLDALEIELMFPTPGQRAETEARLALIEPEIDAALEAVFAPDHSAKLRVIGNRLDTLEMAQALIDDAAARFQAVARRLADLETDTLFQG